MLSEWSVECEAEDPVLVVPWSSLDLLPGGSWKGGALGAGETTAKGAAGLELRFIDLRENPYDLDQVQEAEQHPALLHALRALNAARSPVFTAKCDAWALEGQELEPLRLELELPPVEAAHGFASYIDLVWCERSVFGSFHRTEQAAHRLARHARPLDLPSAMLECIVRPAFIDLGAPQEGFSISVYVKAAGPDEASAYGRWAEALEAVAALLRSKDLAFA